MVGEKAPGDHRRSRREWERVTAKNPDDTQTRTTFRIDAPSPSQEVLAKHDADLDEQPDDSKDQCEGVICF